MEQIWPSYVFPSTRTTLANHLHDESGGVYGGACMMQVTIDLKGTAMSDLTATFTVDATPQEAYEAINDVRSWWGHHIAGPTDQVGAEWFYLVPDIHFSKQRVAELVPGERVVWEFTDGYLDFI